jgi:hypothetical protein
MADTSEWAGIDDALDLIGRLVGLLIEFVTIQMESHARAKMAQPAARMMKLCVISGQESESPRKPMTAIVPMAAAMNVLGLMMISQSVSFSLCH